MAAGGGVRAGGTGEAAGDEGVVLLDRVPFAVVVVGDIVAGGAREEELVVEALGGEEAVVVDFGDEVPRRRR